MKDMKRIQWVKKHFHEFVYGPHSPEIHLLKKQCKKLLWIFVIVVLCLFIFSDIFACSVDKNLDAQMVGTSHIYEKICAITFDDGPHFNTTEQLLDELKKRDIRATFFLVGENVMENQMIVERMKDEGHLIGNHTYTHINLLEVNKAIAMDEITKTNDMIYEITGERPKYIRPPYGKYSNELLENVDMMPVMWSVDPDDWSTTNSSLVVKKVLKEVKSGDIILLHDIYPSSVAAAVEIIDALLAQGYVFVTVDQLLLD